MENKITKLSRDGKKTRNCMRIENRIVKFLKTGLINGGYVVKGESEMHKTSS